MYQEEDLVRIARRENNKKRNYLVVNPLQGKHIPVEPGRALGLFRALAEEIKGIYLGQKILAVGFAETATAIGAGVAIELGAKYMQTTREIIPGADYLFFSEEHSHATEQKLVKNDLDAAVDSIDRVIFVEDEVTTGNTILNIVSLLEKNYPGKISFSVASVLNGMTNESIARYEEREIKLHYLVKTVHGGYPARAKAAYGDGIYHNCNCVYKRPVYELEIPGWRDTRRIVDSEDYMESCIDLWNRVNQSIGKELGNDILVIGTEECMFPALLLAHKWEEEGKKVRCHSTTRSPITVSMEEEYPLHERYELRSLYDKNRVTYLYDIEGHDEVIIVTDAHSAEYEGMNSLVNALTEKNNHIFLVRWC